MVLFAGTIRNSRGDHMDKIIEFEGEKYMSIETDGRYVCENALVEEVDFDFFTSTDGKQILVPVDIDRMPAVVCGLNLGRLKECLGCECEHFVNGFDGEVKG